MTSGAKADGWSWDVGPLPAPSPLVIPGYTLSALLGQGGMGSVFRATDEAGRAVAVKVLLREGMTPAALLRFEREAELLARHRHPGVVAAHAWGLTDQACFLVCELVEGRHIDEAARTLPLEARLDLIEQAARAVGALHTHGVVHRDLKPSNLLVDAAGQVKLIDFGVSTAEGLERLTRTGQFVGTPLWAPPERITGSADADRPTGDVWALGAIAYEVLTGEHPYPAEDYAELGRRAVTPPPSPSRREPALPRGLARVVMSALAPDPARRPPDAQALAAALARARAGSGQGRALLLPGAAALLLLGLGLALLALRPGRQAEPAPAVPAALATASPGSQSLGDPTRARALLRTGEPAAALAALGSDATGAAVEVRAQALAALGRWGELHGLLLGRADLPAEQRRLRGLGALFRDPPADPGGDLLPGDRVLELERAGEQLGDPAAEVLPLCEATTALLARAKACDPAEDPGAHEARRRVQRRVRDFLVRVGGLPDQMLLDVARQRAMVEGAMGLESGPEREGLALASAWIDYARAYADWTANSVRTATTLVAGLPEPGPWLEAQPDTLRGIDASLRLVAAGDGLPPPDLAAKAEAALGSPAPGPPGMHLRRLVLRSLAVLARDAACAAFRRGQEPAGGRELERARSFALALAGTPVARVRNEDRLAIATVALLTGDLVNARQAAELLEEPLHRRLLLAECALVAGELDRARTELGPVAGFRPGLRPFAQRLQLHRRVLAREVQRGRALELLLEMPDDPREETGQRLGLEWHTGPGLYDVLAKGGWWPGRRR